MCIFAAVCCNNYNFRLSYAVWLLKGLVEENKGNNVKLLVLYDIGCLLKRHLEVLLFLFTYLFLNKFCII